MKDTLLWNGEVCEQWIDLTGVWQLRQTGIGAELILEEEREMPRPCLGYGLCSWWVVVLFTEKSNVWGHARGGRSWVDVMSLVSGV